MPTIDIKEGQKISGFTVSETVPLPELNLTLVRLGHDRTGARMVHLASEDDNNLFAVGFRTPPSDSTGVAHILEHTALCGSRRYPVRDPFFSMLKRSLNTFMNAMTASDWTLYPFSSQNRKDFYNLMDIYLDAAFFPLLRERDFSQEGHRLEFAEPDNPDSPLLFKGVVYNEMKGAMASPPSLLARRLSRALYPSTTYGHNSGGEPTAIPDLTWQDLRDFHARHYHPSNAWFFTCGNLPLEDHLELIERQALRHFTALDVDSSVPAETRLGKPRKISETYPVDRGEPLEGRTMVQLGWLTSDIGDSFERLALTVLSSLLIGNPAAPLYKALLDSKLGSNLAPGTGYHDENRTTAFAAGLQGTDPEKAEAIEKLILDTLEKVASEGFSKTRIEGTIHRIEFGNREVTGNHYPYPLALLMRIMGPWIHADDPVSPLRLTENLTRLRREIAAGPFFEGLIRRHLLDNAHRVTLTLRPDPGHREREEKETARRLEELKAALDEKEKEGLIRQARELKEAQEAEEDLSCLPTLGREDIPAEERPVPSEEARIEGYEICRLDQPTNGIGYFIAHLSTGHLAPELLPYIPTFCTMLTQIGAAGHSYLEMAERMEAGTGGIRAGVEILEHPENLRDFQSLVELTGKALVRNKDQLFAILSDLCTAPDFTDLGRLRTVLGQMKASLENSIPNSGHTYAARAAAGTLTAASRLRETWSGLTQVRLIKEMAALPEDKLEEVAKRLREIADALFDRRRFRCAITAEADSFPEIGKETARFLQRLPVRDGGTAPFAPSFSPSPSRLGWATSVPVSYVGRAFRAVPYTHPDAGPLLVLAKLLRSGYLHREIREKGGAYGGLAGYDPESGIFSLLSYRDPQLTRTLAVYEQAIAWAVSGDFDAEQVTEAILAVFSDLDRPLSPGGKGQQEFANLRQGLTRSMRQQLRENVLGTDRKRLMEVAENYLRQGLEDSTVSVLAGEEALNKANGELGEKKLKIERI